MRYFGDSGQLKNKNPKSNIDDQYNDAGIAKDVGGEACWWCLRSPGNDSYNAARVNYVGSVDVSGSRVDNGYGGVRPALWLNL